MLFLDELFKDSLPASLLTSLEFPLLSSIDLPPVSVCLSDLDGIVRGLSEEQTPAMTSASDPLAARTPAPSFILSMPKSTPAARLSSRPRQHLHLHPASQSFSSRSEFNKRTVSSTSLPDPVSSADGSGESWMHIGFSTKNERSGLLDFSGKVTAWPDCSWVSSRGRWRFWTMLLMLFFFL